MSDELRYALVKDADASQVKRLWQYCFDDTEAFVEWYFRDYYRAVNTLGVYAGDRLMGAIQMIPYHIALRGRAVATAYLVGLTTAPEARRGGVGKRMLGACLAEMRQRGQALTLLMPFEGSFYYPIELQFCYFQRCYTVALTELKGLARSYGHMVQLDAMQAIAVLDGVYRAFVEGRHGYILRTTENWQHLIADSQLEKAFCYGLYGTQGAEGYVIYYFRGDNIVVREMAYAHMVARNGLLDFLYGHRSHKITLEWSAPEDDSAVYQLMKTKTGVVHYPFLMARIVDAVQLLGQLAYVTDCPPLRLKLTDQLAPWNDGVFRFEVTAGVGTLVSEKDQADWDLAMGVGTLTQLVMGSRDCGQLLSEQQLLSRNQESLTAWAQLWPLKQNYINEYY